MNADELLQLLRQYLIPVNEWGCGKAKTIKHLLAELEGGEIMLEVNHGKVFREACVAGIDVYATTKNGIRWLWEEKQVFTDGRERTRDIETSIGEKLKLDEDIRKGAQRALREELGVTEAVSLLLTGQYVKGPRSSQSYPGLQTVYDLTYFSVTLSGDLYCPGGYTEVQPDKTTHWKWVCPPPEKR